MFRFTFRMFASLLAIALVFSAGPLPRAWADDGQPPQPTTAQVVQVVSSTTLNGPNTTGPMPNVPGPNGEWAVLYSMLSYSANGCWPFGCTWQLQGAARVELSPGPTARAWTTLFGPNGDLQSTGNAPCNAGWGGQHDCTSATNWFQVGSGHCHNDAETVVFWSVGGDEYEAHTVSVNL